MTKNIFFSFLILSFLFGNFSKGNHINTIFSCTNSENTYLFEKEYNEYPSYREILKKFFDTYSVKDRPNQIGIEHEIIFHKKSDGWHVVLSDFSKNNKIIADEIFWDLKTKSYKELSFKKVDNPYENIQHLKDYELSHHYRFYNICPYYGYIGWYTDVIEKFKGFNYKSDTLLYGIGRAYSFYGANLLNNNSGMADSSLIFTLPETKNSLNKEQLKEYRFFKYKAIEYYDTLAGRNPDFITIVGPIGIKASNERVVAFLDLQVYQNAEEAKKELIDGLYDPFTIAAARNFLNSCEKNAILFTYGDNDTYPLLYVQENLGLRKDVLIVNIHLLSTYRYINYFRDNQNNLKNLPITFKKEDFKDNKRIYGLLRPSDKYDTLHNFIDFVKNDKNINKIGKKGFFEYHSNLFIIKRDNGDEMKIKISKNYILRNELIILDVLQNIERNRPIYFSAFSGREIQDKFKEYLRSEGLVNKLTTVWESGKNSIIGFLEPDHLKQQLFEVYDWTGTDQKIQEPNLYAGFYRGLFQSLADKYMKSKDLINAEEVQDKSIELFPDEILKYRIEKYSCIANYYEMERFSKGNAVARILIKNLKEDVGLDRKEKEMQLMMLKDLTEKYEQTELLELF